MRICIKILSLSNSSYKEHKLKLWKKIKAGKGDHVLNVRGDQPSLHKNITTYFMEEQLFLE